MSSAEFDREKVIDILIDDDFDTIRNGIILNNDSEYLYDILKDGHIGYDNMLDAELITECEERDISYLVADNDDIDENRTSTMVFG